MADFDFFTVAEAAKILGLTEYTVRKKIRDGDIHAIKGASDREGYKIPREALMEYAQGDKRSGLSGILADVVGSPAGLGIAAAVPFVAGLGLGLGALGAAAGTSKRNNADYRKIRDLSIESLQDEIEATQYYIQAMELDDNPSKEDQKKILEAKAKIKTLERQIKEIKLKFELEKSN
ncbi:MAG: helix-turn-helix domain-containing protein [Synergistaceae bacterium]|nr:helix-turn-helix domain-containing protein [Synergistaceae bacterium]